MIKKEVVVSLKPQDEAKNPIAYLVQLASKYNSAVYISLDGNKTVNAKSIMGMMIVNLEKGTKMTLTADGNDEENAIEELCKFLCGE
ncbi:MAG: HPr family phosphocarrier protein [Lachnospiraceae bacterium]|nr:HPr family phosphocarrier protein [Lachnospiraceae bacterium]